MDLRCGQEALGRQAAQAGAAAQQDHEKLTELLQKQADKVAELLDRVQQDSQQSSTSLRAQIDQLKKEVEDGAARVSAVTSAVGDLGKDIASCGKDVAQSIDDAMLCRRDLQQATQRFDARIADVGDELHALDGSVAGRFARVEARVEAVAADGEQGERRSAEIVAALQSASDQSSSVFDKHRDEITARVEGLEKDSQASRDHVLSSFEALERQQADSSSTLALRVQELDQSTSRALETVRADIERNVSDTFAEHGERLAGTASQLRDGIEGSRAALEQSLVDADRAQQTRLERLDADLGGRMETVRASLEEQAMRVETEGRAVMAKVESDVVLLVDRKIGSLEQLLHEQNAAQDTKLGRATAELSASAQRARSELDASVTERLASQDARSKKSELEVHEHFEKQRLDMLRLQTEVKDSAAQVAGTAQHELETYSAGQERAFKDAQVSTAAAIDDAVSAAEARLTARLKSCDSRLTETSGSLSDAIQQARSDIDGSVRERISSLDSAMRSLETATRGDIDAAKTELQSQLAEFTSSQETKLSRAESDLSERLRDVESSSKAHTESLDAGLRRHVQEGLADAETAYTKIHSDLTIALDTKFSELQTSRENGQADISAAMSAKIESTQSVLAQAISASEQAFEQRCTGIEKASQQSVQASKEQLEATMVQQVAQLAGQAAQIESSMEKLIEETCTALDEHWSEQLAAQTKRVADFESAMVNSADATSATLKQQFNQAAVEQNTQLRHLVAQTNDLDLKLGDLKTHLAEQLGQIEEHHTSAAERCDGQDARMDKLDADLQSAALEPLEALGERVAQSQTEYEARFEELSSLLSKGGEEHEAVAQQAAENESQLSRLYTDMAEVVQSAQLTIEEQLNASTAAHDRRLTDAEQHLTGIAEKMDQFDAASAGLEATRTETAELCASMGSDIEAARAAFAAELAQHAAQSAEEVGHRLAELEASANTNLARISAHAEQLQSLSAQTQQDIQRQTGTIEEVRAQVEQTDTRVQDVERQVNQNVATSGQQYAQLLKASNGLTDQQARYESVLQATEAIVNRNNAAVEELNNRLTAVAEECAQTVDGALRAGQDASAATASEAHGHHLALSEEVSALQRAVGEAAQRLGDVEASINTSMARAHEQLQAQEQLKAQISESADHGKAQLDATAQASETRVLGVESRLENLATVLGQELQSAVASVREEMDSVLNPVDSRVTELEAAINTGVVRMTNTDARVAEVAANLEQSTLEAKSQIADVDKLLEAETSGVSAALREAARAQETASRALGEELRSLVEERIASAGDTSAAQIDRLSSELAELTGTTVPELDRAQASADALLKKLQAEVWAGTGGESAVEQQLGDLATRVAAAERDLRTRAPGSASASASASPEEEARLEGRVETLKATMSRTLEMLGRLRQEHGGA